LKARPSGRIGHYATGRKKKDRAKESAESLYNHSDILPAWKRRKEGKKTMKKENVVFL